MNSPARVSDLMRDGAPRRCRLCGGELRPVGRALLGCYCTAKADDGSAEPCLTLDLRAIARKRRRKSDRLAPEIQEAFFAMVRSGGAGDWLRGRWPDECETAEGRKAIAERLGLGTRDGIAKVCIALMRSGSGHASRSAGHSLNAAAEHGHISDADVDGAFGEVAHEP